MADRRAARLRDLVAQQVNSPGDAVARHFGVTGPVRTLSSACSSGALALGAALEAVRTGEVDLAIAGGSDSLCQLTYAGFNALRSVDEGACRPFRAGREGMSFGEGAAVLVLEPLERVLARGGEPLAVLAGAGSACDAHHMTAPDPSGAGRRRGHRGGARATPASTPPRSTSSTPTAPARRSTMRRSGRRCSGCSASARAQIPLTATKALLGHLLGSSGAIEAVATVLCLQQGELHPVPHSADVRPRASGRARPRPAAGAARTPGRRSPPASPSGAPTRPWSSRAGQDNPA